MRSLREVRDLLQGSAGMVIMVLEGFDQSLRPHAPLGCKKKIEVRTIRNRNRWWNDPQIRRAIEAMGLKPRLRLITTLDGEGLNLVTIPGTDSQVEWLRHGGRLISVPSRIVVEEHQCSLRWCILEDD